MPSYLLPSASRVCNTPPQLHAKEISKQLKLLQTTLFSQTNPNQQTAVLPCKSELEQTLYRVKIRRSLARMAGRIWSFVFPEVKLFSGESRAGINFFMSQEALLTRAAIISMEQAKPRVIVASKEEERCFPTVLESRLFARLQGVPRRHQASGLTTSTT